MDVIEYLDIHGNAVPSALVSLSNQSPSWWDGGVLQDVTLDIPVSNPQQSFAIKATSELYYSGTDTEKLEMYTMMYDIGIKFSFDVDSIKGYEQQLVDALEFNKCYCAVYVRLTDSGYFVISVVYLNTKPPKKMPINVETAGGIYTYTFPRYYVGEKLNLSILTISTSRETTCPFVVFFERENGGKTIAGDQRLSIRDIDIVDQLGDFKDKKITSTEYGDYSSTGGYGGGSFDDSSDAFGLPSLPSLGVSEVGFINVYNPTKGQLQGFADELFPDFEMPSASTKEGLEAIAENIANTFTVLGDFAESYINAGLVNYVIDCHIVPVAPKTSGTANIKVGFKTFNYSPAKVISDYVSFDCGALEIREYYQNFLDYEGTRAKLYLPFIGFVDIKPEWFQSGKLGVTYHFNIIDGSCIAFVIATSSKSKLATTVVATFGGNCCVHMPITGVNYSSMISGIVGGAVGIASKASNMIKTNQNDKGTIMSNIEGATGVASNLADAVGAKPSIEQSNGYNAGMSFMCYRRPYMLIERPVASFSKAYPSEQGLPLNVTKKLSSVRGFTTCENVNLDNFTCTEEEKNMLREALREGCIF